jgi:hypothetical protein
MKGLEPPLEVEPLLAEAFVVVEFVGRHTA